MDRFGRFWWDHMKESSGTETNQNVVVKKSVKCIVLHIKKHKLNIIPMLYDKLIIII